MATQNPQIMQLLAPDIAQEQNQLSRRQQMADLLRKQSLDSSGPTEQIGGWAIKKSPWEGISKMAQAFASNYIQDKTDTRQLELAKALQDRLVSTASGGGAGMSPDDASSAALSMNSDGPTNANAATQTQLMAPMSAPGADKYGNKNLLRSLAINALGGEQASGAFWDDQKSTNEAKRGRELGYTTKEERATQDAKNFKDAYIAPVNARPGSILRDPKTNMPMAFNPHVPDGSTPMFDAAGNVVSMNEIPGALDAMSKVERAKTMGTGSATPTITYDGQGMPRFSTKAQDVMRAEGGMAPVQAPTGLPAPEAGITSNLQGPREQILAQIAKFASPQDRANALDAYRRQTGQPAVLPNSVAQSPKPSMLSAGGSGQFMPQLPAGTTANADAAQSASAKTMHESYAKLQAGNSSSQAVLEAIDQLQQLGADKSSWLAGPLATGTTAINPAAAKYEKGRANLIAQLSQQNGTGGTDAGRALTGQAVPDYGKPKDAMASGLSTLRNQTLVQQLKTNFLTSHYQAGDSKQYTGMENGFDQHITPSMAPILMSPAGPARAQLLSNAAKDPAMRAKLEWAAQNGLLK